MRDEGNGGETSEPKHSIGCAIRNFILIVVCAYGFGMTDKSPSERLVWGMPIFIAAIAVYITLPGAIALYYGFRPRYGRRIALVVALAFFAISFAILRESAKSPYG